MHVSVPFIMYKHSYLKTILYVFLTIVHLILNNLYTFTINSLFGCGQFFVRTRAQEVMLKSVKICSIICNNIKSKFKK